MENVDETPNSQTHKGKPKTKSKKNVTEDSEMATENIKGNPKIPIQDLSVSDNSLSSQKVRGKPGPKPKKMPESFTSVGGSPANAKKKVSAKKSMSGSGEMDDSTNESKDLFVKERKTESDVVEKTNINSEPEKKKTTARSKRVENEAEGSNLSKSKGGVKAKSGNINVETSFPSAKFSTKSKNTKNENSPVKGKPGPKPKRLLPEMIKSTKLSPIKLNTESPKRAGKKFKKSSKRPASSSAAERQNSTSDESDTLYSLNEPDRKKFKFDQTDSATSSDSEVILKKPKEMKTSPSPRKMLLKDSIRPKSIDNGTGK